MVDTVMLRFRFKSACPLRLSVLFDKVFAASLPRRATGCGRCSTGTDGRRTKAGAYPGSEGRRSKVLPPSDPVAVPGGPNETDAIKSIFGVPALRAAVPKPIPLPGMVPIDSMAANPSSCDPEPIITDGAGEMGLIVAVALRPVLWLFDRLVRPPPPVRSVEDDACEKRGEMDELNERWSCGGGSGRA